MRATMTRVGAISALLVACLLAPHAAVGRAASKKVKGLDEEALSALTLPPQTVVYYNARTALRDGRPQDVLKLWLLRNALEQNGEEPLHDGDFRSAVWVALSSAGLCHDGIRADDDAGGVGLWPLAMHNWLVRSSSKQPAPSQPRSFSSYDTGFQQRYFSLYDALSTEEMKAARFVRRDCLRPYMTLPWLDTPHWLDLDDRLSTGIMMRDLIEKAQATLVGERVRGQVVLETRLFDIEVSLGKLAKAAVRRDTSLVGRLAKTTGVSEAAMTLVREKRLADVREGEYAALLRRSLTWDAMDWFSLSQNRRLALFAEVGDSMKAKHGIEPEVRRVIVQNIDALIAARDGRELEQWLGFANPRVDDDSILDEVKNRRAELAPRLLLGARGEKLLSLTPAQGFRERGVVALWRGVDDLQRGQRADAMRSFALAMKHSEEARKADEVHHLAKRWFAFVLAVHQADDEALAILDEYVSPLDKNDLLEVLLWRAAFHVDHASFEKIASRVRRGGALDFRIRVLSHLANGDAGAMWKAALAELSSAQAVVKFAGQLTDELATESLDVRANHRATLELGRDLLEDLAPDAARGLRRRIDERLRRIQTLLDALVAYDESPEGRARRAVPGAESYAGSVRLAPADPLPWPFTYPSVQAPSPFSPIQLTPIEWLDDQGARVFGWHIHEK